MKAEIVLRHIQWMEEADRYSTASLIRSLDAENRCLRSAVDAQLEKIKRLKAKNKTLRAKVKL